MTNDKSALTQTFVLQWLIPDPLSLRERGVVTSQWRRKSWVRVVLIIFAFLFIFDFNVWAEGRISRIDFEDAPVVNVVQTLARSAGFDLVLSGDQTLAQNKRATIHLKNVTAEEAIDYILRTNGFNYEKKGNVLLVSTLPQDLVNTAYPGKVETVRLKYLSAARVSELIFKLLPSVGAHAGERANSLILKGRDSEILEVKKLIAAIDKPLPQILIESKIIELTQSDSLRLGLDYNGGAFYFLTNKSTKKTSLASDLSATLNTLITSGKANVVASPRISTIDNHEAVINIGTRVPYAVPVRDSTGISTSKWSVEYIDAGVKLKILPRLGEEGFITVDLQPEVSSVSEWRTTPAGEFPVISTRNAQAVVRVKNGETIMIGGLLSDSNRENISRLPVLGYLPAIGLLFQNKTVEKVKTEIIFMITPYVI